MVHDVRIAMSVILGIGCSIMIGSGISLLRDEDSKVVGYWLITVAIFLLLIILVPIYTAV
jgi:hypothetical protein